MFLLIYETVILTRRIEKECHFDYNIKGGGHESIWNGNGQLTENGYECEHWANQIENEWMWNDTKQTKKWPFPSFLTKQQQQSNKQTKKGIRKILPTTSDHSNKLKWEMKCFRGRKKKIRSKFDRLPFSVLGFVLLLLLFVWCSIIRDKSFSNDSDMSLTDLN